MKKRFRRMTAVLLAVVMVALIIPVGVVSVSATHSTIEAALSWALDIANDDRHGYVLGASHGSEGMNYDCSSFVSWALIHAGIDVPVSTTFYMIENFEPYGFEWIDWSNIGGTSNLQRGDILLDIDTHVEFYYGNNQIIGAHRPATGISVSSYYNNINGVSWDGVLRYKDEPVKNAWLNINRSEIATGESISFSFGAENSNGNFTIGIDRYGTRIDTINVQGNSYEYTFYQDGDYSAYVTAYGGGSYWDSNKVYFRVYKPFSNLGNTFVATICDVKAGKNVITNYDGNIQLSSSNGNINEKWWFTRLDDGSYLIESLYNNSYITTFGNENGSNIATYSYNGDNTQKWLLYPSNGAYELVPKNSIGQRMNLAGGDIFDGANIILWADMAGSDDNRFSINIESYDYIWNLGTDFIATINDIKVGKCFCVTESGNIELSSPSDNINERWWFIRQGDGTYIIESLYDNNYITANGTDNAANVSTTRFNGSDSQKWFVHPSNGSFELAPKSSKGKRINIAGGDTYDGTNVMLWQCMPNSDDIRFNLTFEGNRYIYNHGSNFVAKIKDVIVGKSIKAVDGNVELGTSSASADEKWFFKRQKDGSYLIKSISNGKFITVSGGLQENGTNIITDNYSGGNEQKWLIYPYYDKFEIVPKNALSSRMNLAGGNTEDKANIILWQEIPESNHSLFYITDKAKLTGDINLDGNIDIRDVTAIQRHLAELELFTEEQRSVADTNGDGEINIADATHLQMYLAEYDVKLG